MIKHREWAFIIGRFILGAVMTAHGFAKVLSIGRVVDTFEQLGIPPLMTFAMIAIEVLGGMALLLGIGVKIAAACLALPMVGAVVFDFSLGLIAGFEFPIALFGLSVALAVAPAPGVWRLPIPSFFVDRFQQCSTRFGSLLHGTQPLSFGIRLSQVLVGVIFLLHGIDKWVRMEYYAAMFTQHEIPASLVQIVGLMEAAGGLAILVGIGLKSWSSILALFMIGVTLLVRLPFGFIGGSISH